MINKSRLKFELKQWSTIVLAAFLSAFSMEVFLISSEIVVGGVSGIASILDILFATDNKWYFSAGVWILAIDIPIFIYCFVRYRRRFALKTTIYVVLFSAFLLILRITNLAEIMHTAINAQEDVNDKVMYAIIGGGLQGLCLPMMLSVNASTGGSDVVGLIMQQREKANSSESMRAILISNLIVVLCSAVAMFFFSNNNIDKALELAVYSVAALFVQEIVQETVFRGFSAAIELEITTDYPQEMAEELKKNLKHGISFVKIEGGYSHQIKTMVVCVINKRQLTRARRIIRQVDDKAFAYVESVREVIGKGFMNKEHELQEENVSQKKVQKLQKAQKARQQQTVETQNTVDNSTDKQS